MMPRIHTYPPIPVSSRNPCGRLLKPVVAWDTASTSFLGAPRFQRTIRRLENTQLQRVEACWTDAGRMRRRSGPGGDAAYAGERSWNVATHPLKATPHEVWEPIVRIGGLTGWYYANDSGSQRWLD